jgi:hypothetical protein
MAALRFFLLAFDDESQSSLSFISVDYDERFHRRRHSIKAYGQSRCADVQSETGSA